MWTAFRSEENRLGSPLDSIHGLSVHQSEPPPSHDSFVFSVDSDVKFLVSCTETLFTKLKFLVLFYCGLVQCCWTPLGKHLCCRLVQSSEMLAWHPVLCRVPPWHFGTLHQWCVNFRNDNLKQYEIEPKYEIFSKYFHDLLEISQQHLRNQIFDSVPVTVISWRICLLRRTAVNSGAPKKWKGPKRWNGQLASSCWAHADQGEFESCTWTRVYARLYIFALPSRAEPTWAGLARLDLCSCSVVFPA